MPVKSKLLPVTVIALFAAPSFAEQQLPLTYDVFETAIPHVDLEKCPAELPQSDSFCRATLKHDEIHVFAFSENGDNAMVGFATFPFAPLASQLN